MSDNIESKILNQKFNFITIESGLDDYLSSIFSGGHASPCGTLLREPPFVVIMRYATSINAKGCIANKPDIRDFPFVNFVSPKEIRKVNQTELYAKTSKSVVAVQDACLILPNLLADSLLNPRVEFDLKRGLSFNNPLKADEVYTLDEIEILKNCLANDNEGITFYAKYFNFPVVDLYGLFKKIASDTYITNDKIRANKTNFFSSDGIYPSAFGQAIIANEYIKTINEFYRTNIPFINAGFYLNK